MYVSYNPLLENCGWLPSTESTQQYGNFSSPGYPGIYLNNLKCKTKIEAGPGEAIEMTFTNFNVESSSKCQYDKVLVSLK